MTDSQHAKTLIARFLHIVDQYPNQIATRWYADGYWHQLTYRELCAESQKIASFLTRHGVKSGDNIIVPSQRHGRLLSHLLAILWVGGCYVFIDRKYPVERQQQICETVSARFGLYDDTVAPLDDLDIEWLNPAPTDADSGQVPVADMDGETAAYVMFTSGSTGVPKGAVIPHRGIWRLVVDTDYIAFSEKEVFLQCSSLAFDASTFEIWGALLNGGTCILHPEVENITPPGLQQVITEQKVTTLWVTSSLYNTLISETPETLLQVKQLLTGGEALSVFHIRRGLELLPNTALFNGYGPTENTTFTTIYPIPRSLPEDLKRIPIGFPINGTECALFDEQLQPIVETGVPGELIAFGDGVALGYLARPDLTDERFVEVTCADGQRRKGYRTGDIIALREDGSYDFMTRNDKQVKIDGHRIEPEEIEYALNNLPQIDEARVLVVTGQQGQKRLAAYMVCREEVPTLQLRAALGESLPRYMIPHFMIPLDSLPKNQNGKLDEARLPNPFDAASEPAPLNTESAFKRIAACWEKILERKVAADINFLDCGGTSLEALKVATLLEDEFGIELSATFVFEHPTINSQLAFFAQSAARPRALDATIGGGGETPDLAIVGMACRFPGADDLTQYWQNLIDGKETVRFFSDAELSPEIDPADRSHPAYVKAKGVIDGCDEFDPKFFGISPIEAKVLDPQQRVMLQLCWHALEDAGQLPGDTDQRTGVYVGMNWARYYQQYVLPNKKLLQQFGPLNCALANESDVLSTRISYKLNLKGPSINLFTACSTGLVAVAQACEAIQLGQCEVAIAGGVSVSTPVNSGYMYQEGSMLSKDGHCRPFDAAATGTTFNDGAGVVVLKRRDLAERDGDRIYALIKGYAVNNDGEQKASFTAPSVGGQTEVYDAALHRAAVPPETIGFIEAHGTATPLGDPIEVAALNKTYAANRPQAKSCALGSVKSNIGHAIHAAGVASLIKATLAVQHNQIPPTLFFDRPNPKLELDKTPFFVNPETVEWPLPSPRRAAVTSLGVGGTNAHVILEEYVPPVKAAEPCCDADPEGYGSHSLLLSAKDDAALQRQIESYADFLAKGRSVPCVLDLTYTSTVARTHFASRAALSGRNHTELLQQLQSPKTLIKGRVIDGIAPKTVLMFSGQGAQRLAMGQWLYANSPAFQRLFDQGSERVQQLAGFDLKEILFATASSAEREEQLKQTQVTQPALFLLEYGLARYLISRGVQPDYLLGHSIGEYAAATLAGVFEFEDALTLVVRRGELMQSMPPGQMLAVKAELSRFEADLPDGLCVAAQNAPKLTVVAGEADRIAAFQQQLEAQQIGSVLLKTSHAFHSQMMEPIIDRFAEAVSGCSLKAPTIPIISTKTGEILTAEQAVSPDYWASQIREAVLFSKAITTVMAANDDNPIAFVEIGPGTTLKGLVDFHPIGKQVVTVAALPQSGTDVAASREIQDCIHTLWARGFSIDWSKPFEGLSPSKARLPGYAFAKESYWLAAPEPQTAAPVAALPLPLPQIASPPQPVQDLSMTSENHYTTVQNQLITLLEDVTGYDLGAMDEETHFSEAGLDSLLLTQVATALEREFDTEITFRHLVEDYTCLKDLTDYMKDKVAVEAPPAAATAATAAPVIAAATAMPMAMPTAGLTPTAPTGNALQDLVNQQLQLMQMQIQAMSGMTAVPPASAPAAAAPATAPTASPETTPATDSGDDAAPTSRQTPRTRVSKEKTDVKLTAAQQAWIDDVMTRYQKKYAGSKAYTQKYRQHMADPRSVSGFNPAWKEIIFPIVTERSKGSKLWDIDGNELIDTSNGFGPIFFGHSPDFITDAIKQQLDKGIETGPQSPLAGEVADLFCELTGNERCSFASTGSEAVIGALRLARTVTGRDKVVVFQGAYHGIYDEMLNRPGKDDLGLPAAPGIPRSATSNLTVLPWGEPESLDRIKAMGKELAAVLVEPVQSRKPEFHSPEYLKALRDITAENGNALILDEVVTGFRVHPGGIRKRFDIDADLHVYGKVIGGGYPIGIIGGKARFMDALDGGFWQYGDESIPEAGVTFFAGTFVRHPLALTAAHAVMTKIKAEGMPLYDRLEQNTAKLASEAKAFIAQLSASVKFEEFASLFYVSVPETSHWGHLLFTLMTLEGIHIQQYRPNFLTTEHSTEDIDAILGAFKRSLAQMVINGLLEGDAVAAKKFVSSKPAIPAGARLGKNEHGEPAYFIEDPDNQGNYIEVGQP